MRVDIQACVPDNARRRDIDNIIKPVLDLLVTHRIIEDDSKVTAVAAAWVSVDLAGISVTLTGV